MPSTAKNWVSRADYLMHYTRQWQYVLMSLILHKYYPLSISEYKETNITGKQKKSILS